MFNQVIFLFFLIVKKCPLNFVYQCCSQKDATCNFRLISFLFCSDTVNATKLKQDKNSNRTKITQHTIYSLQIKENVSKPTYPTLPHYLTMLHIILHIMNGILAERPDKNIIPLYCVEYEN